MKFTYVLVALLAAGTATAKYVRCATPKPPDDKLVTPSDADSLLGASMKLSKNKSKSKSKNGSGSGSNNSTAPSSGPHTVDMYWHMVTTQDTQGLYTQKEYLAEQLAVMNDRFAPAGFSFNLVGIDETVNEDWATAKADSPEEMEMKKALRKGDYRTLNIWFLSNFGGADEKILGYSTVATIHPDKDDRVIDGVMALASTIPGTDNATDYPFGLGYTAVHEAGHWLGLLHPFEGLSCSGPGDYVDDTPPQSKPVYGCPTKDESCPGNGGDSIHNFMDYADDSCMSGFTPGQIARMQQMYASARMQP